MALVQFRCETKDISETRRMFAPKKVDDLNAWWKAARTALPRIPDTKLGFWNIITEPEITPSYIRWTLEEHSTSTRAYVIIDRRAPGLG